MTGCQNDEIVEETTNVNDEEFVDQKPLGFQEEWETIEGKYIVFLKEEKIASKFPGLIPDEETVKTERENFSDDEKPNVIQKNGKESPFRSFANTLVNKYSNKKANDVEAVYPSSYGFLVTLSDREAQELSEDEMVDHVGPDEIIAMHFEPLIRTPFIPSNRDGKVEKAPYGINAVGGSHDVEENPQYSPLWVWIVDTGVDRYHPDLNVIHARDFTNDRDNVDGVGHGTHVAGIVAAKADGYGVTGVAAGANIVSVKVLDKDGKGSVSQIVNGLNYIRRNSIPGDVINLSLGGDRQATIDFLIKKFAGTNVNIVMAAGNRARDVSLVSPANNDGPNLYTVGAIDWWNRYQWWSNYGASVDFVAPGLGILSTFPGGKYAYMSGTSMAAPHVSGVLFLGFGSFRSNGTVYYKGRHITKLKHIK
ncbi:MAG: S8 family serine peptidase [Bacteroidota bacterium]